MGVELREFVNHIRQQLLDARQDGRNSEMRFNVAEVTLELQVAVTKGGAGGFEVVFGSAKGEYSQETLQKIQLKLTPETRDGGPTLIAADETEDDEGIS
ncbi:MAG: hypothetical protein H6807_13190 [Planctomycetes bacterium]|nr:hypothetical protein [Planctomycetota bacterium]